MRLQVLAGLAAVATAAEQFEDDDVNFLRFLSSNATVNGTVTTTTAAPTTTTTAAANTTTTAAPTTTAGATTTAAATTTASNATTGGATTTQGQQSEGTTTPAAAQPTTLCSAAAYAAAGLAAPATFLDTMTAYVYKVDCAGEIDLNKNGEPSTAFYSYGARATPQANKDVCVSPGTVTSYTCGNLLSQFNEESDLDKKQGMVQKCCGASPGFAPAEVANFKSVGSVTWGNYSDSQCSTATTGAVTWPMSMIMTSNPMDFTLSSCFDGGLLLGGAYLKFSSCNTTHLMDHKYLDNACTEYLSSSLNSHLGQCNGDGANGTAYYEKWTCTAEAPATKQFSTTLSVDFGGLAGLSTVQLTAVKDAYEPKALATFTTALSNADATITPTHTYTGALATARRRLAASRRRLSGTGGVSSVFVTTLPAAAADTAQAAIVTATSGASALTPSAFKSTIETELAANSATASFASNITATVAAPVVSQTTAVPTPAGGGGAGSTSGAVTNLLGFGSALLMAAAIMF